MADYTVKLLSREDYKTTKWSGGTTTELAIAPADSVYADRDFEWRLSSATVELEESTFTSLPDYNRLIMTLKGGIRLSHNKGEWLTLPEFTVHAFDGGDHTESMGKVVDFNLMLRKGVCSGEMIPFQTDNPAAGPIRELAPKLREYEAALLFCYKGGLTISFESGVSKELKAGESLRIDGSFGKADWSFQTERETSFVLSLVQREGSKRAERAAGLKNKTKCPKK